MKTIFKKQQNGVIYSPELVEQGMRNFFKRRDEALVRAGPSFSTSGRVAIAIHSCAEAIHPMIRRMSGGYEAVVAGQKHKRHGLSMGISDAHSGVRIGFDPKV